MKIRLTVTAVLAVLFTACTRDAWQRFPGPDDAVALVPWFANMSSDISVKPYKTQPRLPVPGTVPITGVEPAISPVMLAPTPANLADLERLFTNPIPNTAESIERGRDRFDIYCSVCHGESGAGDGPVATVFPGVPSIVAARPQGYTDGYLYAIIRQGRGLMPEYGSRIRPEDRWHIVNYLRVLQGTAQ